MIFNAENKNIFLINNKLIFHNGQTLYNIDTEGSIQNKIEIGKDDLVKILNYKCYKISKNEITEFIDFYKNEAKEIQKCELKERIRDFYIIDDFIFTLIQEKNKNIVKHNNIIITEFGLDEKYQFFGHAIYINNGTKIIEFDLINKNENTLINSNEIRNFLINQKYLIYSNKNRVYIINRSTNAKKEYHKHFSTINSLYIDDESRNVYSVCATGIIKYNIESELSKFIVNEPSISKLIFTVDYIYMLSDICLFFYDRKCGKIRNYLYTLNDTFNFVGEEKEENIMKIEDETDLFPKKIKMKKTIEISSLDLKQNFDNKERNRSKCLVFSRNSTFYFFMRQTYEFVRKYKFTDKIAESFLQNDKLIFFTKNKNTNDKFLKVYQIKNNIFDFLFEFDQPICYNVKNVAILDNVFVLSESKLYVYESSGTLKKIIENVDLIGEFNNDLFYLSKKTLGFYNSGDKNIENCHYATSFYGNLYYTINRDLYIYGDKKIIFSACDLFYIYKDEIGLFFIIYNNKQNAVYLYKQEGQNYTMISKKVIDYKLKVIVDANLLLDNKGNYHLINE